MNEDFMEDRKRANYFEVIDLIEKVLPPKQDMNYIKTAPFDLVVAFNDVVRNSGFYFDEETLKKVRDILLNYQERNFRRNSVYLGADPDKDYGFDQNNYSIQNNISEMKNRIIKILANSDNLLMPGNSYTIDRLGKFEDVKERTSRDNIEDYVRKVIAVTWEPKGDIRAELHTLVTDIMLHFGVSTEDFFGNNKIYDSLIKSLDELYFNSKNYHGPRDREGNYDSATTSSELYNKFLEEAVYKVTEILYSAIKTTLDQVEKWEESKKDREEEKEEEYENPVISKPTKVEEKPKDESLESTIKKYEQLQALIAENLELAKKLAEAKKIVEESERKLKENEEKINALR